MKSYADYVNLAKEELKKMYGVGTVEYIKHAESDLATITQSMVMLDMMEVFKAMNNEKTTIVEDVTVKPPTTRGVKK